VLDAFDGDGSLLDVGCANGYFMESIHRWAAERGRVVEPYGLEISTRMAALARSRLPQWADRIWVGNALHWKPPRRFDVVHTGLDYVLPDRRRRLVRHLLRHAVAPGGRVVIRAERAVPGVASPADQLQALGLSISGTLEAVHPYSGERRVTAWIGR
jgi:SAM-dependent methyltransferase